MKTNKLLSSLMVGILFLSILIGCNIKPSQECEDLKKANEQVVSNKKIYQEVWDAVVNKGELDKINETYFDMNVTMISTPENIVGIEAFKDYYKNFLAGFTDVKFSFVDVIAQEDKIVKHWNFKAKNTGEFYGMPPTGKDVDVSGVTLAIMKDGKIAQEQDFMDSYVLMQQLGLAPQK
jgi:steroid delta-isomerase-like uncharacterized protein